MKRQPQFLQRAGPALAALCTLLAVASCGGDGVVGSGGTGSPLGMAVGTVNGFGSVIVDSVSYDDRGAAAVEEVAPGRDAVSDVKLGQRVTVQYAVAGVASAVRVEAAVAGAVASVVSATQFSVLGQTVTINANGAAGPITQFGGGYSRGSDLRVGDAIEVHGVQVRQGDANRIQATRVDKLAAMPAFLRVTGLVSQLGVAGATRFALGALTVDAAGASILPASTVLANGQSVSVLALPDTLTTAEAGAWRVRAAQVRVSALRGEGLDDYVSGSIAHLDPLAKTLTLGSLRVDYSATSIAPAATLADGQYVLVRGRVAPDGSLRASSLTIRDTAADTEAELRGNIVDYDAATGRFSVRDVNVDPSRAALEGCPATGLANGLFVEVEGSLSGTGVVASKLHCEAEPSGAEVEREGVASGVDIAGTSFSIVREHETAVSVRWTDTTYFGGVTPQTLSGKKVHAEGVFVGGVLVASKVKLED